MLRATCMGKLRVSATVGGGVGEGTEERVEGPGRVDAIIVMLQPQQDD
jgi:hypothetical protein